MYLLKVCTCNIEDGEFHYYCLIHGAKTNRKLLIIGITGKARSGKDTVADMLASQLAAERYSFATPLKQMLKVLGLEDKDDQKARVPFNQSYRYMAQTLGTEWGRELIHPNLWVLEAERRLAETQGVVVISDVRFENEAAWIRKNGVLIHVQRPEQELIAESNHSSEAGIEANPMVDYKIVNNGTLKELESVCESVAIRILRISREGPHYQD